MPVLVSSSLPSSSSPSSSGALLLEEPELSLNTAIVRVLPTLLAQVRRSQDLQILLSTHAPEILDDEGVSPVEVLVLQVGTDGSTAEVLAEIPRAMEDLELGLTTSDVVAALIEPGDLTNLVEAARGRR